MAAVPTILVQADIRDAPLLRRLAARGYRLAGFPTERVKLVQQAGVPIGLFQIELEELAERATFERRMASAMLRWSAALDARELGRAFQLRSKMEQQAVVEALRSAVQNFTLTAVAAVEAFDGVATAENVRLLLMRNDIDPRERALALAARQRGIPAVDLPHGIPFSAYAASDLQMDAMLLYGPSSLQWAASVAYDTRPMRVTGNPAWDHYSLASARLNRELAHATFRLDPSVPTVLFAETYGAGGYVLDEVEPDWPWRNFEAVVEALAAVRRQRPVQLVVKFHPGATSPQAAVRARQRAEADGIPVATIAGHAEPWQLVHSDCIICIESSLGVEALLLDRPVINLRLEDLPLEARSLFDDCDAVVHVRRREHLPDAIEALLFDPATQARLASARPAARYHYAYLADGRATDRAEQALLRLLDPPAAAQEIAAGAPAPLQAGMSQAVQANVRAQHLALAARLGEAGRAEEAAYLRARAEDFAACFPVATSA